jgi:hypothetical protein
MSSYARNIKGAPFYIASMIHPQLVGRASDMLISQELAIPCSIPPRTKVCQNPLGTRPETVNPQEPICRARGRRKDSSLVRVGFRGECPQEEIYQNEQAMDSERVPHDNSKRCCR